MTLHRILALCLGIAVVAGGAWYFTNMAKCFSSGGGVNFLPPVSIVSSQPLDLDVTLHTWGDNSCISDKYWEDDVPRNIFTNVQCHYRLSGEADYKSAAMTLLNDKVDDMSYRATYRCAIPPQKAVAPANLEYYFDYGWADNIQTLTQKPVPFQ